MKNEFQRPLAFNCAMGMPKLLNDLLEYVPVPAGQSRAEFCAALLENLWDPTQFVLAERLAGDAEAAKVLDRLKFAFETATFECLCCETRCGAQHYQEKVGPLMTTLVQHPALVDSAIVDWHVSAATAARATHAWQNEIYHRVLSAYGDCVHGIYYLRYYLRTTPEGRRQLEIELDRHVPEQLDTTSGFGPEYRCCRAVPQGIENITLTLGNVQWPVYIDTMALDGFKESFGGAFTGSGITSTLFHVVCCALMDGQLWGNAMDKDSDGDGVYLDFTVGGIPCGHFWGYTVEQSLVFAQYSPYAATENRYGKEPQPHEEPVAVLADLLTAPDPLTVPQVPCLSDATLANLVALATELRRGWWPANDVTALRTFLARKAGAPKVDEDEYLVEEPDAVE